MTKDQSNSSAAFGDRFDFDRSELLDALQNDVKLFETAAIDAKTGKQVLIQACVESALPVGTKFLFEHENRNLTQLQCDTLCVPIHYGVEAEVAFVAKPLESGEPLLDWENNELGLEQKTGFAIDLFKALESVHSVGLVHRNIQSKNVFLVDEKAILGGVCLERFVNVSDLSAQHSLSFSTYVSPELSGALVHDIGPPSDLYSMGAVLFHLFYGRPPFEGGSASDILFQHLTIEPDFESTSNLPRALVRLIKVLLKKDPPDRYQTAASVIFDLTEIKELVSQNKPADDFVICRHEIKPAIMDPAFVGRADELQFLVNELASVNEDKLRSVLVSCPSGIGKSRLILEFIRHATRENFNVMRGRGSDEAGREPMGPLLDVIHQLGERLAGEPRFKIERLQTQLAGHEAVVSVLCPDFAKTIGIEQSQELMGPDEFGQGRINLALAKLLAAAAWPKFPLMIWIDDCQWLDEQTLSILSMVSEFSPRSLLLLFSMRSECESTIDEFVSHVKPDCRIELGPLSDDEVRLLQESMTGPLPFVAAQTVIRHAMGSPFMASAVVRGMFESNAITPVSDGWKIDDEALGHIQAADDAAQVLLQRLQQLPPRTLELLSAAAIIGKEFDLQSVLQVSNADGMSQHLEIANRNRLIWSKPNGILSFVHDKIRETLIGRLGDQEKRELHLLLAEFFQMNRPQNVFDLAFHFQRAARPKLALPYALEAASIARNRFSLGVAEDQLNIAIEGLESADSETRFRVHASLADVIMLDGRYEEAESWLHQAANFANKPIEKAKVVFNRGELEFKRGNKTEAVEYFETALKDLGYRIPCFAKLGMLSEVAKQSAHSMMPKYFVGKKSGGVPEKDRLAWKLFSRLAHGYWFTRDKYQTLWAHLRALNLAEKYEPTAELAQCYAEHAPAMSLLPWHSRGLEYADRSLKIRKQFGDVWGQGQSRNFKSILLYSASDFEAAIDQALRATTVLERTGDYWEIHIARYQRAASLYRRGNLTAAVREARETYKSALERGDFQSTANIIDVWVRANLNRLPDEIHARELARSLPDIQGQCQILLADGVKLIGEQKYSEAAKRFEDAIYRSKKGGVVNTYVTPNYPWLATALRLEFGQRTIRSSNAERAPLRRLLRAAKKADWISRHFANERPHALRELGLAYALANKRLKSKRAVLKSIEVARAQGAYYEEMKSQKALTELAADFGWPEDFDIDRDVDQRLHEIENPVADECRATSLSISDRFANLLEAGRNISSASTLEGIDKVCEAWTNRLLRSQRATLIDLGSEHEDNELVDMKLVELAVASHSAWASGLDSECRNRSTNGSGSYLACPIVVNNEVSKVLYAANDAVYGLFGENEKKIAEFLATTTGSAIEKANSFNELEEMNRELESRVKDRTAIIRARSDELEKTADELRQVQTSLEEARDAAQQANDTKSEFLARMSHEIRTPITAILGFTELMMRGIIRPEDQQEKFKTILGSGRHLLRLVNNLLDLSKVEADQMEFETVEFNPCRAVNEVVESLKAQTNGRPVELTSSIVGDVPHYIKSDTTRFRQIVTNLVGNALKFTEKGFVKVSIGSKGFDSEEDPKIEKSMYVEIEDTGIGMTSEQTARIFDPFAQADTSITRKFGGSGLGLSISKRLAEEMDGTIEVESEPNVGSRFRFEFALTDFCTTELVNRDTYASYVDESSLLSTWNHRSIAGRRILIVDDAATNRDFLQLILGESGAELETCENGQQAVDLISNREFDLVLMDMQMPVLDGYSATRQLRELGIQVPVIALTANNMKNDDQKCFAAGCTGYLSKPIETCELLEKISWHTRTRVGAHGGEVSDPNGSDHKKTEVEIDVDARINQLANVYRQDVVEKVAGMKRALEEHDFEAIADSGHAIKGTAAMVGLDLLAQAGQDLDQAGKEKSVNKAYSAIQQIELLLGAIERDNESGYAEST